MKYFPYFLIAACICLLIIPAMAETGALSPQPVTGNTPIPRSNHATVTFDNKMWVIGGEDMSGLKNDVWHSTNGIIWTCTNASAGFSKGDTTAVVYDKKIWVIVYTRNDNPDENDSFEIWSSSDGSIWTLSTNTPDFGLRLRPSIMVYNDKMWVIGGGWDGRLNDVWYSTNGVNWTCTNTSAGFPGGWDLASYVYDNRMWVAGSYQPCTGEHECQMPTSYVWSSADGIIWTEVTGSAGLPIDGSSFVPLIYDNRVWLFTTSTVWSSENGVNWTCIHESKIWPESNYRQAALVYDNRMWVLGTHRGGWKDDVWYSADGALWVRADATKRIWPREYHSSVVFQDTIWLIGGRSRGPENPLNDTWYSSDGTHWSEATPSAKFSPRREHTSVVFDNKMWVIGGYANGNSKNDVWSSEDGITWSLVNESAEFSPRDRHSSVVFDNKMWVIGGSGGSDIWSSPNGNLWTCANASLPFMSWFGHTAVVFNDKLWVVGTISTPSKCMAEIDHNEVWYSSDGITWECANASLHLGQGDIDPSTLLNYNGRMWLVTEGHTIWSSADGRIWDMVTSTPAFSLSYRRDASALVYDNKMWVLGGQWGELLNDAWYSTDGISWSRDGDIIESIPVPIREPEDRHGDFISAM
ncbi:MAG: kelch repeat-containing protein [Methanoregula sp.]